MKCQKCGSEEETTKEYEFGKHTRSSKAVCAVCGAFKAWRPVIMGEERKRSILLSAVKAAGRHGLKDFTARQTAEIEGATTGLVFHYFNTVNALREAVVAFCIDNPVNHETILLQAIATDPTSVPVALRNYVLENAKG